MVEQNNEKKFSINREHLIPTFGLLFMALLVEIVLLLGLNLYGTKLGLFLLLQSVLIQALWMLFLSMSILAIVSNFANNKLGWIAHYFATLLLFFLFIIGKLNSDLQLDVSYTWILNKTALDMLGLKYLYGWTIIMTFAIAILILLSDPRLTYKTGSDGKGHIYVHSKVISLLRLILTDKRIEDAIGNNADSYIIDTSKETKKESVRDEKTQYRFEFSRSERTPNKGYFNDLVRLNSIEFIAWCFVKVLFGIAIATQLADSFANRYLLIKNYLASTGGSWSDLASNYLHIAISRMSFSVNTALDFGIVNAPTFEFMKFIMSLVLILVVIWTVRIVLSCVGEILVAKNCDNIGINIRNIISNVFAILAIWKINSILAIPSEVFIASTPYTALQTTVWFVAFVSLAIIIRRMNPGKFSMENIDAMDSGEAGLKIFGAIFIIILLFSPSIIAMFTVNRYIEGKREEYVWKPGNLPSIEYVRWSHEADNITQIDYSAITMSNQSILNQTRIFNDDAARRYMKPSVGANNWMSIDNANVDIIYLDGGEKWASILTLVSPPFEGDTDTWRAKHLLQTHSEKMLMIDAATTEPVDAQKLIGGNDTPTFYYGEGGLWSEVDEVYLEIPGYTETHLPEYKGPIAYNDRPDYVYSGFWRVLKFFFVDWNYALGNYGDIKTLTQRDVHNRVSSILLPGMEIEPRAQPVLDGKGNVYKLYWVTLRHASPHEYADYPEGKRNDIIRRFAVVLVNTKNGEITGFNANTDKADYLLTYYRSFYPNWNKPLPDWLIPQMRHPETFFEEQIDTFNFYFQEDFQKYQRNEFYELTLDDNGNPMEDVRYIMMPLNGEIVWTAERPVEWYKGATRNLAGMYLAPGGSKTGQLYFVGFNSKTIIGPATALSSVKSNTKLTQHPYFPQWVHGNILMYSSDGQYYVIPYYKQEQNNLLPQMIAVVNAETRATGFYIIQDPQNYREISKAVEYAFRSMGTTVSATDIEKIEETIADDKSAHDGTYVVILIKGGNGEIIKRIPLSSNESVEILQNK